MSITKKNGTKLRPSSKKQKIKVTKPKLVLGKKNLTSKHLKFANEVFYHKANALVKEEVKEIVSSHIPSFKSKKYLTRKTILKTTLDNSVEIKYKNNKTGFIYGILL